MRPFSYYKVASVAQAVSLVSKHQQKAAILAGGFDLLGMMKNGLEGPKLKMPGFLIDIKGIKELNYIREKKDGLKIGAATPVSEIVSSALIAKKYPFCTRQRAKSVFRKFAASERWGETSARGRVVGIFAAGSCRIVTARAGIIATQPAGKTAITPSSAAPSVKCYMVHPSDLAPALIALNGRVEITSAKGNRTVPKEKFYVGAGQKHLGETVLSPAGIGGGGDNSKCCGNEQGRLPQTEGKAVLRFALVSVAVSVSLKNNIVDQVRIVFGGVAPYPMRTVKAEGALKGKVMKDALSAACKGATDGAQHLNEIATRSPLPEVSWNRRSCSLPDLFGLLHQTLGAYPYRPRGLFDNHSAMLEDGTTAVTIAFRLDENCLIKLVRAESAWALIGTGRQTSPTVPAYGRNPYLTHHRLNAWQKWASMYVIHAGSMRVQ